MNIDKHLAAIPGQSREERARVRANATRLLADGTEEQKVAAVQLIDALDAQEAAESEAMRERLSNLPVAARVLEAFTAQPMSENECKTIQALLNHPGSTSTELSRACGHDGMIWQMHFGNLCKERQAYLWPAPRIEKRDSSFFSGILADFDTATSRFTMKPDVAAAFVALGLKAPAR